MSVACIEPSALRNDTLCLWGKLILITLTQRPKEVSRIQTISASSTRLKSSSQIRLRDFPTFRSLAYTTTAFAQDTKRSFHGCLQMRQLFQDVAQVSPDVQIPNERYGRTLYFRSIEPQLIVRWCGNYDFATLGALKYSKSL